MKRYAMLFVATLAVMVPLDMFWIGGVAQDFYKSRINNLELHLLPALLFYPTYVAGIVIFVHARAKGNMKQTLIFGALFGFFAYATYDLTNLATLRGWSAELSFADMAWGTCITAIASATGLFISRSFMKILKP